MNWSIQQSYNRPLQNNAPQSPRQRAADTGFDALFQHEGISPNARPEIKIKALMDKGFTRDGAEAIVLGSEAVNNTYSSPSPGPQYPPSQRNDDGPPRDNDGRPPFREGIRRFAGRFHGMMKRFGGHGQANHRHEHHNAGPNGNNEGHPSIKFTRTTTYGAPPPMGGSTFFNNPAGRGTSVSMSSSNFGGASSTSMSASTNGNASIRMSSTRTIFN